jgi:hypothetical protein
MAVLIRHRIAGMDPSKYDEISPRLVEKLKTQPGRLPSTAGGVREGTTDSRTPIGR